MISLPPILKLIMYTTKSTDQIIYHVKLVVCFILGVDFLVIFLSHMITKCTIVPEHPLTVKALKTKDTMMTISVMISYLSSLFCKESRNLSIITKGN